MIKIRVTKGSIGEQCSIEYKQLVIDDEEDTELCVLISGNKLCWIAGKDKETFQKELEEVINKYRI